jgi:hypothetical protein
MAITHATGFPICAYSANGPATLTISPATIGDLFIFSFEGQTGHLTVATCPAFVSTANPSGAMTILPGVIPTTNVVVAYATITVTGSQTLTLTYNTAITGAYPSWIFDELTIGKAATWAAVSATLGNNHGTSTGDVWTFPTDTSSYPALQAYWGAIDASNGTTAPYGSSTSGFSVTMCTGTGTLNPVIMNGALTPSTSYSPVMTTGANGTVYAWEFIIQVVSTQGLIASLL